MAPPVAAPTRGFFSPSILAGAAHLYQLRNRTFFRRRRKNMPTCAFAHAGFFVAMNIFQISMESMVIKTVVFLTYIPVNKTSVLFTIICGTITLSWGYHYFPSFFTWIWPTFMPVHTSVSTYLEFLKRRAACCYVQQEHEQFMCLVHFTSSLLNPNYVADLVTLQTLPPAHKKFASQFFEHCLLAGLSPDEQQLLLAYVEPVLLNPRVYAYGIDVLND